MAYDKSKAAELYNFFTGKGLAPAHAAGIVANGIVESGLNPAAYNANEDAVGMFQHRGDRLTGLRAFAQERGETVKSLSPLTNAGYVLQEGAGPEKSAMDKVYATSTPGDAAAAFDQYYERSDGSARAQRVAYANQIYADMTGENPPQASASSPRNTGHDPNADLGYGADVPAMPSALEDMKDVPLPYSTGTQAPIERLMQGDQGDLASQIAFSLGRPAMDQPQKDDVPTDMEAALSAALGIAPTTPAQMAAGVNPADYSIGSPVEGTEQVADEDTTHSITMEESTDPRDKALAASKAKAKRRAAMADMLQIVGVGLGQMSAGQAVDATAVMGQQEERRQLLRTTEDKEAEKSAAAAAEAAKKKEVATLLLRRGNAEAAALAYTDLGAATNILQTMLTPSKDGTGTPSAEEQQAFVNYLVEQGEPELARYATLSPDSYKQVLQDYMPDGGSAEAGDLAPEERQRLAAMALDQGMPAVADLLMTGSNPKLLAGAQDTVLSRAKTVAGNADTPAGGGALTPEKREAAAAFYEKQGNQTMADSIRGGFMSDEGITKNILANQEMQFDIEKSAQIERDKLIIGSEADKAVGAETAAALNAIGINTPETTLMKTVGFKGAQEAVKLANESEDRRVELAQAKEVAGAFSALYPNDPTFARAMRSARNSTDVANVLTAYAQLNPALIKEEALYKLAKSDPEFGKFLGSTLRATAGIMDPGRKMLFDHTAATLETMSAESAQDRKIMASLNSMKSIVTAPGYEGGIVEGSIVFPVQQVLNSIMGDSAPTLLTEGEGVGLTAVQSLAAATYQLIKAPGAGSLSNWEGETFMQALPGIGDTGIQAAALIQVFEASAEARKRNQEYLIDYVKEYQDSADFGGAHQNAYLDKRAAEDPPLTPFMDFSDAAGLDAAIEDGSLQLGDVYTIRDADGNTQYRMFKE